MSRGTALTSSEDMQKEETAPTHFCVDAAVGLVAGLLECFRHQS
jgi:hypothetical protein